MDMMQALDILDGIVESSFEQRIDACKALYKAGAHMFLPGRYGRIMKQYGVL